MNIKAKHKDSVVTYAQGGRSYTVKLSEATPEQLKKVKEIFPELFEKDTVK